MHEAVEQAVEHAAGHSAAEAALATLAIAVFLGILAQVVAHRLKLPAILPLLVAGMAAGPFGLNFFDPEILGPALEAFIHIGVAVVLFEGGLNLELKKLAQVGRSVRNLLSIGVVVTGFGAAALARWLTGIDWQTAALFGAIVTVTGPTVIAPLLRHMIVPRKVRTILLSEGLIIDPIGAVLAYLMLQWIERAGQAPDRRLLSRELLLLFACGALVGYAAGMLARYLARNRHTAGELRNLAILALLLGGFLVAERIAPQSGIVAAIVMGLVLSNADVPDLVTVKGFKEQLTVLIISVLFVLLSAQLDLGAMQALGLNGLLVTAGLIFIVRPLSVLASIPWRRLGWREKTVLGLTAPRGIVAAAVASLSAIQMTKAGYGEAASILEGLVYLTILVTCTWATIMAILLPRLLGYLDDPSRRLVAIVGADSLTAALAKVLQEREWSVVAIDSAAPKLSRLKEDRILTIRGDARLPKTYEDAGIERDSRLMALTANDELNLLVADLVRNEFGVEHPVVALQHQAEEIGRRRMAWVDLLGGAETQIQAWNRDLDVGRALVETIRIPSGRQHRNDLKTLLREETKKCLVLCSWRDGKLSFRTHIEDLERYDELTLLLQKSVWEGELTPILAAAEAEAATEPVATDAADDLLEDGAAEPA